MLKYIKHHLDTISGVEIYPIISLLLFFTVFTTMLIIVMKMPKKNMGMIFATYGNIYIAQISIGANPAQALKAIAEAEAYNGPSLIIAYAHCINHGINMGKAQTEQKRAVEAGYWHLYRYNPDLKDEGKNPFTMDSKEPTADYKEFIEGEIRYKTLQKQFPEAAEELFEKAAQDAKERYEYYKKMAE